MNIKVKYIATKEIDLKVLGVNENKFDRDFKYRNKVLSKIERAVEKRDKDFYDIVEIQNAENGDMIYEI